MNKLFLLMTSFSLLMHQALFADDVDAMPPRDQGMWQTLIMVSIALLFFYFILMRPEQKRRKEMEDQRSALKKGDLSPSENLEVAGQLRFIWLPRMLERP